MLDWLKTVLGENYSDEIDKKVSTEIGKNFVARSDFNTKNEAYKALQEQISERDKQLEELKKVDAAGLQTQILKLQGENKAAKENYEKQLEDMRFDYALDGALSAAKCKNNRALKALLDASQLKLDGNSILGLDSQLEKLRAEADYLFESDTPAPSFSGPTPGVPISTKPTSEMTYSELAAYAESHPNAQY